jgi:trans-aconitate methyltransferase
MRWNPQEYASNSSAQAVWADELIARLGLSGSERVLDVGCGDGRSTAELARRLPAGRVLGVDSSPEHAAHAALAYPPSVYPRLSFAVMDARSLASDEPFDLVFSNATLHWVDDHPAFLRGCVRVLRPGGCLVASCGGKGNAAEMFRGVDALIAEEPWHSRFIGFAFPYHFHSPEEYRPWLAEAGLEATRVELVEKDMTHAGADGLTGWVRTTWLPYLERVPHEEQGSFVAALLGRYLAEHPPDGLGRTHVRMVRLEVEARRT